MSAKAGIPGALVLTVLGAWLARAQEPGALPAAPIATSAGAAESALTLPDAGPTAGGPGTASPEATLPPATSMAQAAPVMTVPRGPTAPAMQTADVQPEGQAVVPTTPSVPAGLSSWITYTRPDCCGPVGGDGPVCMELFVWTGPTLPVGGNILSAYLDTGWMVQGGGRSIFFNPAQDAAWTVDLSLSHMYNHSKPDSPLTFFENVAPPPQFGIPSPPDFEPVTVHLRQIQRTFGTLGVGREWYLNVPANTDDYRFRAGFDTGGRLGTAKADFREIQHTTDTIYGYYLGGSAEVEVPYGCCCFYAGVRAEWGFTWIHRLLQPQNPVALQDVNLLLTAGVRF